MNRKIIIPILFAVFAVGIYLVSQKEPNTVPSTSKVTTNKGSDVVDNLKEETMETVIEQGQQKKKTPTTGKQSSGVVKKTPATGKKENK